MPNKTNTGVRKTVTILGDFSGISECSTDIPKMRCDFLSHCPAGQEKRAIDMPKALPPGPVERKCLSVNRLCENTSREPGVGRTARHPMDFARRDT